MKSLTTERTQKLKDMALRHGFMGVGISKAERLDEEANRLEKWLSQNYHGEMEYMANHFDKRVDPTLLVPGAKSVVSLMYNYYPGENKGENERLTHVKDSQLKERMPDAGYRMPDMGLTSLDSQLTAHTSTNAQH